MSFSIHFKKKLWLLFILIVNSSTINSQKAIINGIVRDGEDLEFFNWGQHPKSRSDRNNNRF